jgi:hypothetical protein
VTIDDLDFTANTAREAFTKVVVDLMESNNLDTLVHPTCQVVPPTHEETDSGRWNAVRRIGATPRSITCFGTLTPPPSGWTTSRCSG